MHYTRPLIGNAAVMHYLQKVVKNGIVPHAQIWVGPNQIGKKTFLANHLFERWCAQGKACLKCLTCRQLQHDHYAGLRWLEGSALDMATVRSVIQEAAETSLSAQHRAIVITQAEQLGIQVYNALLKLLEEPRNQITIYLLTTSLDPLPATVQSRCSVIYFQPVPVDELSVAFPDLAEYIGLANGLPGKLLRWQKPTQRQQSVQQLQDWLAIVHSVPVERLQPAARLLPDRAKAVDLNRQLDQLELVIQLLLASQTGLTTTIDPALHQQLGQAAQQYDLRHTVAALHQLATARRSLVRQVQPKLVMTNLLLNIYPSV
ncbi:MAG: hypothetical protein HY565_04020 [Candidatus Kerfeldbacteria bacterium]|nr:hypothetical protein [Candidatus Kerfeldbacteria bacterium]